MEISHVCARWCWTLPFLDFLHSFSLTLRCLCLTLRFLDLALPSGGAGHRGPAVLAAAVGRQARDIGPGARQEVRSRDGARRKNPQITSTNTELWPAPRTKIL